MLAHAVECEQQTSSKLSNVLLMISISASLAVEQLLKTPCSLIVHLSLLNKK
jgi:hypothetical protein